MNITAIIQARMGSTRLPGKVMKRLIDKSVLGHVITRCQVVPSVNQVVVATTVLDEDDEICREAERYGASVYRGSKDHVLSRYYEAAKLAGADVVVRVTSDCPLLDPNISDQVIRHFLQHSYDYSSSGLSGTFPRGLDTEVFTFAALEKAYLNAHKEYEFEHVTPYIYQHPEIFNYHSYSNLTDESRYRITLDTQEDWELIRIIYEELYKGALFFWPDIRALLEARPDLVLINSEVVQKKLGE
ncbi:glycosyltransferase family protein [Paenibacillus sp. alder61]|uniref:Acylneuraminate cytidylyltransferase n=1 Tax=Paenibacillus faecis TaxID=862114 RepID=A0A5D0CPK2_9BACL|nr:MULTISPECIES: glycosyltransferase family protein [Paenibacillus]MCA1293981.1 glycosyltransferase family protein [Paenibacillus sp. alder61]TYA11863.1 acylneuraminate cytidylyltransferase [Paenibacillus faecis]